MNPSQPPSSTRRVLELLPHDPAWNDEFEREAQQLQTALGAIAHAIHPIGSTAIPHIYAKPVIDILVEAQEINQVDSRNDAMNGLGYQVMGEFGISGRRYFRKEDAAGKRTHHVHIFQVGSPDIVRHLAFRDYMIAHPDAAQQYSDLKRSLIRQIAPGDIDAYMDGKNDFIKTMQARAICWYEQRNSRYDSL